MKKNPKVLIADDETNIRNFLGELLEFHDMSVLIAEDGAAAWTLLQTNQDVDIVISDIYMPKLNGVELMKRIRKSYPGLPVILITAYSKDNKFLRKEGETVEPDGFFQKPFDIQSLVNKIYEILSK